MMEVVFVKLLEPPITNEIRTSVTGVALYGEKLRLNFWSSILMQRYASECSVDLFRLKK
jgi:hypothetical protein